MIRIIRNAAYRLYAGRLRAGLAKDTLPNHVALVIDGNRRWARAMGYENPSVGHRRGAEHVHEVLGWCEELGITRATVFLASTDNLRKRPAGEVDYLARVIEEVVVGGVTEPGNVWRLHPAGRLDALPDSTRDALKLAADVTGTRTAGFELTVAVGYDGRDEIVDAIRSLLDHEARAGATLDDVASRFTADDIAAHLYTGGRPDPDLVIRTSGEMRMSGFLLWQAAYSELYFCDLNWPAFRKIDFLRALRAYSARTRRFGR
ncbi:polyprenyl diphosphate synthase [Embleya sp. NPDC005971]|uniref:polyprenyl diphosphate synthase n=1 Tax=unclassified Embleya TaxID=2699296 RepID=UPI0033CE82D3